MIPRPISYKIFLRSTSYIVFPSNNTSKICVRTIINVYKIISEKLFSTNKSSEIHLVIILTDTETETTTATNVKWKFLEKIFHKSHLFHGSTLAIIGKSILCFMAYPIPGTHPDPQLFQDPL